MKKSQLPIQVLKLAIYFGLTINFSLISSCNKFLDKKPDARLSEVKSLDHLQKLLDDTNIMNLGTPSYGEISADDYFVSEDYYNSRAEIDKNAYRWMKVQYNYPNDWSRAYNAIFNSNLCLELIDKITTTKQNETTWNTLYGSAHFYRSYYFQQLAWVYARTYDEGNSEKDLGIPLRLNSDFNVPSKRASLKETYDQIIFDAKVAAAYLPNHSLIPTRPSKSSAYGLLARTYLSMGKYDSSLKYSNLSLAINNSLLDYNTDIDVNSTSPFPRFNKEIIFYSEMYINFPILAMSSALADTLLIKEYNQKDIRRSAFFTSLGDYLIFKGSYSQGSQYFSGITSAEMYLIRAEAYVRADDINSGIADLNTLLKHRWVKGEFVPISIADKTVALQKILEERRKELIFRGLRWMDLKRLNKEGFNILPERKVAGNTYNLVPNSSQYLLSIPADIISQTGIEQN